MNDFMLEFILFIVFLVLKLTGVIAWSWWWVTSPLWMGLIVYLLLSFIGSLFSGNNINRNGD